MLRYLPLLALCFCLTAAEPPRVQLVTTDIDNFWRAYDLATPENRREIFQREYLDKASPGLKDFIELRIRSVDNLLRALDRYPDFYRTMRPATLRIRTQEDTIRGYLRRFQELYPPARFPDVYFVIGIANSGGTSSDRGLLIGAEMHARAPATDESQLTAWHKAVLGPVDDLPAIVLHELVHFERRGRESKTLLNQSLGEGAADFVSGLVVGHTINSHLDDWAEPRRDQLFREFAARAHGDDIKGWLYDGDRIKDRPADLGYWIGSEICRDYYERASDKSAALRDIVELKDPAKVWRATRYAALLGAR